MPDTDAVDRAEEIGGPSEGYERPEEVPTDADEAYDEGDEEPDGLSDEDDEEGTRDQG